MSRRAVFVLSAAAGVLVAVWVVASGRWAVVDAEVRARSYGASGGTELSRGDSSP